MATTTYKATFIFNMGRNGWSESFYLPASSAASAISSAQTIAQARQKLLATNVIMDGVRLSTYGVRGSTLPVPVPPAPNVTASVELDPGEGVLFSLRFGSGAGPDVASVYRRNFIMRGLASSIVTGTQVSGESIAASWAQQVANFFTALSGNTASILANTKTTTVAVASSAVADLAGNVNFTTLSPHGLVAGNTVLVAGLTHGWKKVNGTYQVLAIPAPTATTFSINKAFPTNLFFPPALIQQRVPIFASLLSWTFERSVYRDTGKAFFVTRGRYKTRPLGI